MQRLISATIALLLILSLVACGAEVEPAENNPEAEDEPINSGLSVSSHEIGPGPQGWVVGITVQNNTDYHFVKDAQVTVTNGSGAIIGQDRVHMDVTPWNWNDYPVHCAFSDSYHADIKFVSDSYTFSFTRVDFLNTVTDLLPDGEKSPELFTYGNVEGCAGYTFPLGAGSSLVIYVQDQTDLVAGFFLTYSMDAAGSELETVSTVMAYIIAAFADDPDAAVAQLTADLGDGAYNHMPTADADLVLMVNGSQIAFTATPIQ